MPLALSNITVVNRREDKGFEGDQPERWRPWSY